MAQNENNVQPLSVASANASSATTEANSTTAFPKTEQPAAKVAAPAKQAVKSAETVRKSATKTAKKATRAAAKSAKKSAQKVTKKVTQTAAKNASKTTQYASRAAQSTFEAARENANKFSAFLNNPNNYQTPYQTMENLMTNNAQFEKAAQQAADASRQGVEAWVKSCNILMRGYEDIVKTCLNIAQESTERNSEAVKSLLGCKTLNELTEAQNQIAQRSFDDMVTSATKLSEISIKVATDTIQPINDQIGKTVRKATNAA